MQIQYLITIGLYFTVKSTNCELSIVTAIADKGELEQISVAVECLINQE